MKYSEIHGNPTAQRFIEIDYERAKIDGLMVVKKIAVAGEMRLG